MQFHGFMTQCGEADPLPLGGCYPAGESSCQFTPAVAYQRLHASDKRHPLTYATNIQWLQPQTNEPLSLIPASEARSAPITFGGRLTL